MSGEIEMIYTASVTSSSISAQSFGRTLLGFTVGSYDVVVFTEYIAYNWLALLGSIGGAAAFATVVHSLVVSCFEALFSRCCPCVRSPKSDDEEDDDANHQRDQSLIDPLRPDDYAM